MTESWQESALRDGWHLRLVAILREDERYRDGTCVWHVVRWPHIRHVIVEPPRPVPPELPEPWLSDAAVDQLICFGGCLVVAVFVWILMWTGVI